MQQLSRRDLTALFILIIAAALVYGLPLDNLIFNHRGTDYVQHLRFAQELSMGNIVLVHIGFHLSTLLVSAIPIFTLEMAAWIVTVLYTGITACILYLWIRPVTSSWWVALSSALLLLIVTPISIFPLSSRGLYFGYIGINVVHNPTIVPLKMFSLLALLYGLRALQGKLEFSVRNVVIGAVVITLSMFSKPNFALVLLPVLVLVLGYRGLLERNFTGTRLLTLGLIAPMILLLVFQFVFQYYFVPNPTGSRIVFDPLATLWNFESSRMVLTVKFFLSIAFPLVFTVLYRRTASRDLSIILGWLMLAAGAAQMYLFSETGIRRFDGNFWWSAQIALFLLFAACARHYLQHYKREPRAYITGLILALHVVSGVVFLVGSTIAVDPAAIW